MAPSGKMEVRAWIWSTILVSMVFASELAPIARIPQELVQLLRPDEIDDYEHPGVVERNRRASGMETKHKEEYTYTLHSLGGAPCILAQTECTFLLDYRTLQYGVQTVKIILPKNPEISGSCVRKGDTAVLTMHWSVFNFSLVFTENPEGNSYYLNKAILKYNQSLDVFWDATYRGAVILETSRWRNYYFTPLGRSYRCEHGEDQGPLKLFNEDDELVGNMTLWNTRFQPFVKRAKGKWGPEDHCLSNYIQVMREDVVPYVVSGVFLASVIVCMAAYALWRKFQVKKTDYGFYGADGTGCPDGSGGGEVYEQHEMDERGKVESSGVHCNDINEITAASADSNNFVANGNGQQQAPANTNPFKAAQSKNPFQK